eukprot:TRINITY_DN9724_c0_g1_i1.p1 TRINITY_DN9724_c0_g1~~TRINITY_DN9724_c0_g1_i1.p1  ORF type:complete len:321 (+),score=53.82 TRINITY_DN9724_c0_g1_i1:23-985(+)
MRVYASEGGWTVEMVPCKFPESRGLITVRVYRDKAASGGQAHIFEAKLFSNNSTINGANFLVRVFAEYINRPRLEQDLCVLDARSAFLQALGRARPKFLAYPLAMHPGWDGFLQACLMPAFEPFTFALIKRCREQFRALPWDKQISVATGFIKLALLPLAELQTFAQSFQVHWKDAVHRPERLVHCDLKLENLLLDVSSRCLRLCDYDFMIGVPAGRVIRVTGGGGTPSFLAPEREQFLIHETSDVYNISLLVIQLFFADVPLLPKDTPLHETISQLELEKSVKEFLIRLSNPDPTARLTAAEALKEPIMVGASPACLPT